MAKAKLKVSWCDVTLVKRGISLLHFCSFISTPFLFDIAWDTCLQFKDFKTEVWISWKEFSVYYEKQQKHSQILCSSSSLACVIQPYNEALAFLIHFTFVWIAQPEKKKRASEMEGTFFSSILAWTAYLYSRRLVIKHTARRYTWLQFFCKAKYLHE